MFPVASPKTAIQIQFSLTLSIGKKIILSTDREENTHQNNTVDQGPIIFKIYFANNLEQTQIFNLQSED